jgi:protein-S-isoprenylcysteine O-methyltransferase Ste14
VAIHDGRRLIAMRRIPSLGPRGEGWLALQAIAMVAVALAYGSSPDRSTPGTLAWAIGWLGVVVGAALTIGGGTRLSRAGSFDVLPKPRPDGVLVETGVYRFVRHPIYAGLIVVGLGFAVLRVSVATLLATVALAVILDVKRRREEDGLLARFPSYADYRRRVKALIPLIY